MDKNLNTASSLIPGLDILKFVMALLVVAIHAEAVNGISGVYEVASPLISCAVPVFFVISAYLVFRKIRVGSVTPPLSKSHSFYQKVGFALCFLDGGSITFGFAYKTLYGNEFVWIYL